MSRRRSSMRSSDATAYSTRWRPCRFTTRPRPPIDIRSWTTQDRIRPEAATRSEILARITNAFAQRFNGRSPDLDSHDEPNFTLPVAEAADRFALWPSSLPLAPHPPAHYRSGCALEYAGLGVPT